MQLNKNLLHKLQQTIVFIYSLFNRRWTILESSVSNSINSLVKKHSTTVIRKLFWLLHLTPLVCPNFTSRPMAERLWTSLTIDSTESKVGTGVQQKSIIPTTGEVFWLKLQVPKMELNHIHTMIGIWFLKLLWPVKGDSCLATMVMGVWGMLLYPVGRSILSVFNHR